MEGTTMDTNGLRVEGACVRFPGAEVPALDDVDVDLSAGRVLAVLGPSGCGKSTLLRAVAGLQRLDAGRVSFGGEDVTRVPTHKRDFALMFQDGQLFGHLDVAGNVGYALARRGVRGVQRDERIAQLLDLVGLSGFEKRSPATLSGGQQQRVALARALAARPRLLLLDEPLSALDRSLRERLAGDLRAILTAEAVTALFVTHDHAEALTVADDMAIMRDGRIVQHGLAHDVWSAPRDAETADFLGFTTSLDAKDAVSLGLSSSRWALRRSGIRVVAGSAPDSSSGSDGVRALPGVVVSTVVAEEATRVVVRLDALPGRELSAVAFPGEADVTTLVPDARIAVVVDPSQGVELPG